MKLPPPPPPEVDDLLEVADVPLADQRQPPPPQSSQPGQSSQSQPGQSSQPQPPPRRSTDERLTSLEQEVVSLRTEFHEYCQETSGTLKKALKYISSIAKSCRRHDDAMTPSPPDSV